MQTQSHPAIATGVEIQPLPDGTFQIEFFDDDGESLHQQNVDLAVLKSMPALAQTTGNFVTLNFRRVNCFPSNPCRRGPGKC